MTANEFLGIYGEINNGAHHKPADLVGAPALVWHQAFWNSKHDARGRTRRTRTIKAFLGRLYRHLKENVDRSMPPLDEEIEVLDDDRVRSITYSFKWFGVRTKIRTEIHTEYVSITTFIDASLDTIGNHRADKISMRKTEYGKIEDNFVDFVKYANPASRIRAPKAPLEDVQHYLYFGVWHQFSIDIFQHIKYLTVRDHNIDTQGRVPIGLKFADFRSVVTCEPYPAPGSKERRDEEAAEVREPNFITTPLERLSHQLPFYRSEEDDRAKWERAGIPTPLWARRRLNAVWPFLKLASKGTGSGPGGEPPPAAPPLAGRTEFTVSRLLDGRVLYATALGPQPKPGKPGNEQPLLFYMHSVTQCPRQIGRLLDRLCSLGTLRLAAIVALPSLKRVSQEIWSVDQIARETRGYLHKLIQLVGTGEKDNKSRGDLNKNILDGLEDIHSKMARLSAGKFNLRPKEFDPNLEIGDASIEYRLVRSTYYERQFSDQLRSLRIQRLEGYQPYDEFVRRRLQSAFNFIRGVNTRIEQIKGEWRSLDQLYLTTSVTLLTDAINKQQESIGSLQKRGLRVQRRTEKIQTDVGVIQIWGEAILIGILVPYYLISVFDHVEPCERATRFVGAVSRMKISLGSSDSCAYQLGDNVIYPQNIAFGLIFFLLFGYAFWKLTRALDSRRMEERKWAEEETNEAMAEAMGNASSPSSLPSEEPIAQSKS
jgi:hypothetical protein